MSCKKEEKSIPKDDAVATIENYEKIVRFLSITLNVTEDRIVYDSDQKQFYVPNTVYREDLEEAQQRYNGANEYKLTYENQ
ncbi:hypothetical protein [Desertivirga xinjiangensis]|uniref:hypothetical protein n=1 Tax=Desertivirga xinjiangensis TaxID=539206 RepID=UPI00210D7168|nr:hypothetical protein [Pedobacter xinjiangensis]